MDFTSMPLIKSENGNNDQITANPDTSHAATVESKFVLVAGTEASEPIELPCDAAGNLVLSTLAIMYPGAQGLKYKNTETGFMRLIAPVDGVLHSPYAGWGTTTYIACCPSQIQKRPWAPSPAPAAASTSQPQQTTLPGLMSMNNFTSDDSDDLFSPPVAKFPSPYGAYMVSAPYRGGPATTAMGMRGSAMGVSRGVRPSLFGVPGGIPRGGLMTPGMPGRGGPVRGRGGPPGGGAAGTGHPIPREYDYCNVCEVSLNSAKQAEMHYVGKKHLEVVAKGGKGIRGGPGRGGPRGVVAGPPRGRGGGLLSGGNALPLSGPQPDYTSDNYTPLDGSSHGGATMF